MGCFVAQLYPVYLSLKEKAVLVVGGGAVAERKVLGLLPCEARITVVSPEVTESLAELAQTGAIVWQRKGYESHDLEGAEIVFVATDDREVNERASADAQRLKLPVNVADCPSLCTFFLPSVLRRGPLSIAVSTEGAAPLLARRLREGLEDRIGDDVGIFAELLARHRGEVIERLAPEARAIYWDRALDGSVLRLIAEGRTDEAEDVLTAWIDELSLR